jgi:phosphatidylserine/phosphatidylglycerophosphate/cardiolipin synthase-like enzyme
MLTLITCAQAHIHSATVYFNPDERSMNALCDAVDRGVSVTVLVPGEHADKRFVRFAGEQTYTELLHDHFSDDLRSSDRIDPADRAERGLLQRAGERLTEAVDRWL